MPNPRRNGFTKLENQFIYDWIGRLGQTSFNVYILLRMHCFGGTECRAKHKTLGAVLGKSERTIARAIKDLERHQLIKRLPGRRDHCNRYKVWYLTESNLTQLMSGSNQTDLSTLR